MNAAQREVAKLLIYGINYHPEITGVGKYSTEMAEWLAGRGHHVSMVTAAPYYPEWKIHAGYSGWRYSSENLKGVKIWRCPLFVPVQPSFLSRIFHHLSFAVSSAPALLLRALLVRPDVIVVIAPSIACGPAAALVAWLTGAKTWLHVQDFEFEIASHLRGGRWLPFGAVERWLLRRFRRVSTISAAMVNGLVEKGVPSERCRLFPNWVDTETFTPATPSDDLRERLGLPRDKRIILYSGTVGIKHGLEVILDAAKLMETSSEVLFVIAGDGADLPRLQARSVSQKNVRWLPLQPVDRIVPFLNLADIHVVPQLGFAKNAALPSKVSAIFAVGGCAVVCAVSGGQLASSVQGAAQVVPPQDPRALAGAIGILLRDESLRGQLKAKARERAVTQWRKETILAEFETHLLA